VSGIFTQKNSHSSNMRSPLAAYV